MDSEQQKIIDDDHLRLLRIGYLIAGGWNCFWALFPLVYVAMGIFVFTVGSTVQSRGEPDARFIGVFIAIIGVVISVLMAAFAVLKLMTAKALRLRKSRTLCLVTAALSCVAMPYGTALGVATFLLLSRPSVREQFD